MVGPLVEELFCGFPYGKILIKKHKGKVPKTFEQLEELPGVGHKVLPHPNLQATRHVKALVR